MSIGRIPPRFDIRQTGQDILPFELIARPHLRQSAIPQVLGKELEIRVPDPV
jgi:hypothetical protein